MRLPFQGLHMLEHIHYVRRSIGYCLGHYRGALLRPRVFMAVAKAAFGNQVNFLRRTSRLRTALDTDTRTLNRVLKETKAIANYCAEQSQRYTSLSPSLINPSFGPVLYAIVRILHPEIVVETGVGSGFSTTFLLSALAHNDFGRLYSIDLLRPREQQIPEEKETGWLIPDNLKDRWEFISGDARQELPTLLDHIDKLDCFFHDSDHSYEYMSWEFGLVYPRLQKGGFLLSDDTTFNMAWDDFVRQHEDPNIRIHRIGLLRKAVD